MGNAFPTSQERTIYFFISENDETVEHTDLSKLQRIWKEYIDRDLDVTEIRARTETERFRV